MRKRICLALDLRDDAEAIVQYDHLHQSGGVWPEVIADLRARGYAEMTIWRLGNRLFMIAEIDPVPEPPANPETQPVLDRWQALTSSLQQALPGAGRHPQWIEMHCVFDLREHAPSPRGAR